MAATTITTGAVASATSISNATDMAGKISITMTATAGIAATINFNSANPYGTAAVQVILTPTNLAAAQDVRKVYISSTTTTTFVISIIAGCAVSAHTYNYHVIETQTSNGTFGAITVTGTNWLVASQSRSESTDVAGIVTIQSPNPATAPATITFPFGSTSAAFTVAPIVVLTPLSIDAADALNRIYVTSSTTAFTLNLTAVIKVAAPYSYSYHVIETQ